METKSFVSEIEHIDGRVVKGISSVFGNVDGGNDIIHSGAFTKTVAENLGRVVHLWQHDFTQPPTAAIKAIEEVKRQDLPKQIQDQYPNSTGGLLTIREYLDTPRGNEILTGLSTQAIKEMSIGYDPIKFDFTEVKKQGKRTQLIRNLRELRLWDTSDVNWGMNPATVAAKSSIPFMDTGHTEIETKIDKITLADFTDQAWEELSEAEIERISAHFAWQKHIPAESFSDLCFLHHQPAQDGVGPAVKNWIQDAFNTLHTEKSIVNSESLHSVFSHLEEHSEHWKDFQPNFDWIQLAWDVAKFQKNLALGKIVTPIMEPDFVKNISQILDELTVAKPLVAAPVLTQSILAKLEIANTITKEFEE